jgi:ribosomal protein S18 acetylase RimI-like enzyme
MRTDIALRPANEKDADFLWELHSVVLKPYVAATWGWDEEFQYRYFNEHFNPNRNQIIRYMGSEVGVMSIEETAHGYVLSTIEIMPQYQGLGIGTALIRDLLEKAATRGLPVSLRVLKVNPACQLYLRLGFLVVGETETHYWMRKEGQPRQFLPQRWETTRCFLDTADEGHIDAFALIFTENLEILELINSSISAEKHALQALRHLVLPPGGVVWREHVFLIRDLESRESVGLLAVYFGYPTPETMYIGSLYLRPMFQGHGIGREIVADLEKRAIESGFREARVSVGLKNWRALRFWTSCDYNHITRIKAERDLNESTTPNVELLKTIATSETGAPV